MGEKKDTDWKLLGCRRDESMRETLHRASSFSSFLVFSPFFYGCWRQHLALLLVIFGAVLLRTRNPLFLIVNARIKFVLLLQFPPMPSSAIFSTFSVVSSVLFRIIFIFLWFTLRFSPLYNAVWFCCRYLFHSRVFATKKTNQNFQFPSKLKINKSWRWRRVILVWRKLHLLNSNMIEKKMKFLP